MSNKKLDFWKVYEYVRNILKKKFCKNCGNFDLNEIEREDCESYIEKIFPERWKKFDPSRNISWKTFAYVIVINAEKDFCKKKRYKLKGKTNFWSVNSYEQNQAYEDNDSYNPLLDNISINLSPDIEKEIINKIYIEELFSNLTDKEKLILKLKYIDGYLSKEIANLFKEYTEKQINKIIEQAKNKIRKHFRE